MADVTYQTLTRDDVLAIFAKADLHPRTLARNEDNSFVASFNKTPIPVLNSQVAATHDNIVILEPEALPDARQPNQDPELSSVVRFAFID